MFALLFLGGLNFPVPEVIVRPVEVAHAEEIPLLETPESREAYAEEVAQKYHLDWRFVETLRCESMGFTWNDQSLVPDPAGPNGREPSYGLAQFYIPSVLTTASGEILTKEIALDPRQAIDAAGYNFSIGNESQWTCYRNL